MRPGQNNKRMRGGRPTNNRRGPNPLTRSYESNGPDVKIRGNAHHIAEKYLQLARDAHTGGDPVAAENYLQHAEHYFRLIASAQAAQLAAQGRAPGEADLEDDEDDDGGVLDRFASPAERAPQPFNPQAQPQPYAAQPQPQPNGGGYGYNNERPQQPPFEGGERQPQAERNNGYQPQGERNNGYQQRNDRQQNRMDNRPPRPPYGERNEHNRDYRNNQDGNYRNNQDNYRNTQDNRQPREFRNNYRDMNANTPREQPQPVIDAAPAGLPSFITAAPRAPAPVEILDAPQPVVETPAAEAPPVQPAVAPEPMEAAPAPAEGAPDEAKAPRGRRRRVRSPFGFNAAEETPAAPSDVPSSD